MNHWVLVLGLLSGLLTFNGQAAESELKTVESLVKDRIGRILEVLRDKDLTSEVRKQKVLGIADPLFDYSLIAGLSMRAHWKKLSKEEKEEFTQLFTSALQNSYLEKIALFTDETVEYAPASKVKGRIHAMTTVVSKDRRYEVIYKFHKSKSQDQWLVYDVEIEGVSVVKSFGMQYSQFLAKSSTQELLAKMRDKVIELPDELKDKGEKSSVEN